MKKIIAYMAFFVLLASPCFGTEYFVDDSRPDDTGNGETIPTAKKTIQAGLDLGSANDTISIVAGTYTGAGNVDLTFIVDLTVRAIDSNGDLDCLGVIMDGEDNTPVRAFYLVNNSLTNATLIWGIKFQNFNMAAASGGTIYCLSDYPIISNCWFHSSRTTNLGGAIFYNTAVITEYLIVRFCLFTEDDHSHGSAYADNNASIEFVNCTFTDNHSATNNDAIASQEPIIMTNCVIYGNDDLRANESTFLASTPTYSLYNYARTATDTPGAGCLDGASVDPLLDAVTHKLQTGSPCIDTGSDPFSDGDGDQYDLNGNKVWDDSTDSPTGGWADGVEMGAFAEAAAAAADQPVKGAFGGGPVFGQDTFGGSPAWGMTPWGMN